VHPQRGLCVMGYSVRHETSNFCQGIVGRGARTARSRAARGGRFRDAPLADPSFERPGNVSSEDRQNLGCASQTARNAIRTFNERGLDALTPGSSRPKRVHAAFDERGAEALRGMLHRSAREFGRESSLWTLEMAADVAFEEGLTEGRLSGETIRAILSRLLGVRWMRAKRWITSPDPLYERKKGGATG
jgi:transposase